MGDGQSSVKADAFGTLLLPDGDTVSHVLRIHETAHIGQRLSPTAEILSGGDSLRYSPDTLRHRLATDSVTWQIGTYVWYAPGYRYPVFETMHTAILSHGKAVRHFERSYYYPLVDQAYDLDSDLENIAIREADAPPVVQTHQKSGPSGSSGTGNKLIDGGLFADGSTDYNYFIIAVR